QGAGGLIEVDGLVGWHLEEGVRYGGELGIEVETELAARAGERLLDAADGAMARADSRAAEKLLTRALDLLDGGSALRLDAQLTLANIAMRRGDLDRADGLITDAEASGRTPGSVAARLDWLSNAAPDRAVQFAADQ